MQQAADTWLILTYFANIDGFAAAHHIDDRLPWLQQKHIRPILLSSPCGLPHRGLHHKRVPSPAPSGIRYELRYFLRRHTRSRFWFKFWETVLLLPVIPFYFLEKLFVKLDSPWSWFLTSSVAASFMTWRHKPTLIYSTGGPWSAHVAALLAARLNRVPCIVECQDPLTHYHPDSTGWERRLIDKVESFILKHASAVIFLTQRAAQSARERHPDGAEVLTIYAGANPPASLGVYRKQNTFNIGHFGSLAGSRNLGEFLAACVLLLEEAPQYKDTLRLVLYGTHDKNVLQQITEFPHENIIAMQGKVSRQESVRAMHEVDVLLLIKNREDLSSYTIPCKAYEYLFAQRPMLALIYGNAEEKTMFQNAGHIAVEMDDITAIKDGLKSYLEKWQRDELGNTRPSPFTTEDAVDQLIALARRIPSRN